MGFQPQISWQVPQIMADFNADMDRQAERRKQEAAAGKASKALLKALSGETGMDPTMIEGMSYQDAAAQLSAVVGKQHYQKGAEDLAGAMARRQLTELEITDEPARRQLLDVQTRNALAAEANTAAFPAFAGDVARFNEPGNLPFDIPAAEFERYALPEGQTGPDLSQVLAAAGRTGYNPGAGNLDDIVRAMNPNRGIEPSFFTPEQFGRATPITTPEGKTIPGAYSTVIGPRQGQIITDPSTALQTQQMTDADGNVHTVMVPPRGAPQVLRPPPEPRGKVTDIARYQALSRQIEVLLPFATLPNASPDTVKELKRLQAERDALERGAAASPSGSAPDAPYDFDFDVKTGKLVPRK